MKNAILSGLPVVLIGTAIVAIAGTYPVGTVTRMGPGFLPVACGVMLIVLGALVMAFDEDAIEPVGVAAALRPIAAVIGGLVAWTLIAARFGLVPATFALVGIVAFAQPRPGIWMTLLTAALLSAFGVLVFITGLNIRLSAFRF